MNQPRMVLRPDSSSRSRLLLAIVVIAVLGGGYLLYEMGRYHAGFNIVATTEQIDNLETRVTMLERENADLRMVLVQVKQHHRQVYGKVEVTVDGARNGERVTLPLRSLLPEGGSAKWTYGFRYFQDFDRELELPDGFRPEKIHVELAPSGRGNQGIRQSFDWTTASS